MSEYIRMTWQKLRLRKPRTIAVPPFMLVFFFGMQLHAQPFDLVITNGHVIDPKNEINVPMDIAIVDGRIAQVEKEISPSLAKQVVDATDLIVAPGFIDIHTHVFVGPKPKTFAGGFSSVSHDDFSFRAGITTVVDAGTSGWRNFEVFKESVIDQSTTRVLAFLNIAGGGMQGSPHEEDLNDMDARMTALMVKKYPEIIVGTKIGHYSGTDWAPFDRAIEAGDLAGVPLLLECHLPDLPIEQLLGKMRPGDIFTHTFGDVNDRNSILDKQKNLQPFVLAARNRGVRFDVGHGGGSFHFSEAIPATEQGFWPDAFGTDLHRFSMNSGMKDMLNIMSKFLNLGLPVKDIVDRATWNAAQMIQRTDLGNLSPGSEADITIVRIQKGDFGFIDSGGERMDGNRKFETELTIRAGRIVYDLNGLGAREPSR